MNDNMLDLINNTVANYINRNYGVAKEKKEQTIAVTSNRIHFGLKQVTNNGVPFHEDNVSITNSSMTEIIISTAHSLVEEVGISLDISNSIAKTIVPMVVDGLSVRR